MTICPAPYALLGTAGDLIIGDVEAPFQTLVGPPGKAHVWLSCDQGPREFAGWVNDVGLANGMQLNAVGGLVLIALGAKAMPYAGPIVVTGWRFPSAGSELRPLLAEQVAFIRGIHADARRAAGLDDSPPVDAEWVAQAREVLEEIRAMPRPTLTFRSGPLR